jgi:peptide/nickel transport system substrate-binding protein
LSRAAAAARLLALLAALPAASGCVQERPPPPRGVLTVSQEQQASWVRNFNPLAPGGAARWPTQSGIYEPLLIFNTVTGEYVPWLATGYEWRQEHRVLRIRIRGGVTWSDGAPFDARDVTFTFQLLRRFPALDLGGVWGFLQDVRTVDAGTVDFVFSRVFFPGLDNLAVVPIVPEHAWKDVADPVTFPNETPVATGPFTEVRVFKNQVYELGRNPRYWQPGKPAVEALRFPAHPGNERANLGLVFDEVDWAGSFVPAIDRVYVSRDRAHHHYWFPLIGGTIFLYANATRPPFDDRRVRRAISMAIDRQLVVDVALYGYSRPADATGLNDAYTRWRSPEIAASADWVRLDVAAANALLDQAGFRRGPDGLRRMPDGRPWRYEILTVAGYSDWVRAAQVIARGLKVLGIEATVRNFDFAAWFQRLQEGRFDLSLGWSVDGPTPYTFYRWLMSSSTVKPVGVPSMGNWHRYASPEADRLIEAFEREPDPAAQRRLVDDLQRTFVAEAPAIPLFPQPSWGEFNSRRFTGFPSGEEPYAALSPNKFPDCLLVLTSVRPR